jgi:hypothetical protein
MRHLGAYENRSRIPKTRRGMPDARQADARGEQRNQRLEMAGTWDNLATQREQLVRRHPELSALKNSTASQES